MGVEIVRLAVIPGGRPCDGEDNDGIVGRIEAALGEPDGILWLTDKRGRKVAVPTAKIAYIELGSGNDDRRVGFGAS